MNVCLVLLIHSFRSFLLLSQHFLHMNVCFINYSLLISTTIFAKMADPKPLLLAAGFRERGNWHDVINFTFPT